MSTLNFDATNVTPAKAPGAVPTAWYNVMMTESEVKPTSAGDGTVLKATLQIIDGPFAKRVVFTNFNRTNPNPVAVEIGNEQLSAVCHAVGVLQVPDSSVLHGIPFQARVVLKPAGQGNDGNYYDEGNDVKGYKAVEGGAAAMASAVTAATPVPADLAKPVVVEALKPAGPATPASPAAPAAPAAPAVEVKYQTPDGQWTREQLTAAGYQPAQIDALPQVAAEPAAEAAAPWQKPAETVAPATAGTKPPWEA